ncbi:hypothetical protein DID88_006997 [Monilinia fructigena]|uniref:Uncharacterized protein n=1 Tax=Monilinia fructigena TaxID=38457 RepID=A0A395IH93_9HELO|nr:hypothetical protein DID88_006997 [Monilinia fructigena]
MLSDYSGSEDNDPEEYFKNSKKKWEWRFALVVEDANPDAPKDRVTLIVGNYAAQTLLNLREDACDLRTNPEVLSNLKETLFKLWGDLEEQKSAIISQKAQAEKERKEKLLSKSATSTDSESDDEDDDDPQESKGALPPDSEEETEESPRPKKQKSNKPKKLAHPKADTDLQGDAVVEKERILARDQAEEQAFRVLYQAVWYQSG